MATNRDKTRQSAAPRLRVFTSRFPAPHILLTSRGHNYLGIANGETGGSVHQSSNIQNYKYSNICINPSPVLKVLKNLSGKKKRYGVIRGW